MSKKPATTALQQWITTRNESAADTAAWLDNRGLWVHRETVRRWRSGSSKPCLQQLRPLADITGIPLEQLL